MLVDLGNCLKPKLVDWVPGKRPTSFLTELHGIGRIRRVMRGLGESVNHNQVYQAFRKWHEKNPTKEEALEHCSQALDDWLHSYAPEFCGEKYVAEKGRRLKEAGGTVGYITDAQEIIRSALGAREPFTKELVKDCRAVQYRGRQH